MRIKIASLPSLSQIKIASFVLIVTDQNCQFYPYCHRSRLLVLSSLSKIKIASFFLNVAVEKKVLLFNKDKTLICDIKNETGNFDL